LERRKKQGTLKKIRALLTETKEEVDPRARLPLLVETLEYGRDSKIEAEALELVEKLRDAFPEEYRSHLDRKEEVRRLRELMEN
jgi:hypothetical protein